MFSGAVGSVTLLMSNPGPSSLTAIEISLRFTAATNMNVFSGILMIAVQALEKRTAEQREEVEALKAENATLKALLEALRK